MIANTTALLPHNVLETLLSRTLEYVLDNVPYYQHLLRPGVPLPLSAFPIIRREQIAQDLESFLVFDRFPDYMIASGGTSDAPPAITFRNSEEYEAAHALFLHTERYKQVDPVLGDEFTLDVFFNSNGYSWRKPTGWPLLTITLEQRVHAEAIRRLIEKGLSIAGKRMFARRIQAQNGPLRALTGYFSAVGFHPKEFGIRSLLIYGAHLSRVWRTRLQSIWGIDPLTSYGLSEIGTGNAILCTHCSGYHYWTAWAEFLSVDGKSRVESGDAALVLTTLVPFAQVQPRIRYWTGDIVTVLGYCRHAKQYGFRFRGREISSVIAVQDGMARVVLSEVDVLEVLESLNQVNCRVHPSEQQIWADKTVPPSPFTMGFPRFYLKPQIVESEPAQVHLAMETSFDPNLETRAAAETMARVSDELLKESEELRRRVYDGSATLTVSLHAAGSIPSRIKTAA